MSDYASSVSGTYQAPYRYNSTTYEPDGSSITNGSNLTDFVTFCSDCHNASNTIYSTTLSRNLYAFDWAYEKHGGAVATNDYWLSVPPADDINDLLEPYKEATANYVLSCTDCHEPHGSPNLFMIRRGVNGGTDTTSVTKPASETPDNTKQWKSLCGKCHDTSTDNNKTIHHRAYVQAEGDEFVGDYYRCVYCHEPDADDIRNCLKCHYHGSTQWPAVNEYGLSSHTYNGGEKMF
jgi:cytochrome c553